MNPLLKVAIAAAALYAVYAAYLWWRDPKPEAEYLTARDLERLRRKGRI